MVWNNQIGWKFVSKLINVQYGIRACWVENFVEINKRTHTFIKYSRVDQNKKKTQNDTLMIGEFDLLKDY